MRKAVDDIWYRVKDKIFNRYANVIGIEANINTYEGIWYKVEDKAGKRLWDQMYDKIESRV